MDKQKETHFRVDLNVENKLFIKDIFVNKEDEIVKFKLIVNDFSIAKRINKEIINAGIKVVNDWCKKYAHVKITEMIEAVNSTMSPSGVDIYIVCKIKEHIEKLETTLNDVNIETAALLVKLDNGNTHQVALDKKTINAILFLVNDLSKGSIKLLEKPLDLTITTIEK